MMVYGGQTAQGRVRFPLEVFKAMRQVWPQNRPFSVRFSCSDWHPEGLSSEDLSFYVDTFKSHGCDLINTSTGQTTPYGKPEYGRLYQVPFSERIRLENRVPTMVAGGISSYADINSILVAGRADLCLVGRAHLFDPYWTRHAAYEQGYSIPWSQPYFVVDSPYRPRMEWCGEGYVKD